MKKKLIIGIILISLGIFYLKVISPVFQIHIPCVFKEITGLDCPGCGMTRAALAMLDGDFYQAFRFNMLVFVLAPIYLLYLYFERKNKQRLSKCLMGGMLILSGLFFILRNTEMFNFLAPTHL